MKNKIAPEIFLLLRSSLADLTLLVSQSSSKTKQPSKMWKNSFMTNMCHATSIWKGIPKISIYFLFIGLDMEIWSRVGNVLLSIKVKLFFLKNDYDTSTFKIKEMPTFGACLTLVEYSAKANPWINFIAMTIMNSKSLRLSKITLIWSFNSVQNLTSLLMLGSDSRRKSFNV